MSFRRDNYNTKIRDEVKNFFLSEPLLHGGYAGSAKLLIG